jgi:hypothetical protein
MIIWNPDDLPVDGTGRYYVPSLITEKIYPDAGGLVDIDTDHPMPAGLYVVDGYGYVTSKSMSIFFETPVSNTTTTTSSTTLDWEIRLGNFVTNRRFCFNCERCCSPYRNKENEEIG